MNRSDRHSRLVRACTLSCMLLALAGPAFSQSPCRDRAQRLMAAVRRCRERMAVGQISACTINISWRNDQEVSLQEAESLAAAYSRTADRYEALTRNIDSLRAKIRLDQRAITMHGFSKREQDFEDWANLSANAKQEFEDTVVSGLVDTAFLGAKQGLKVADKRVRELYPSKVEEFAQRMRGIGIKSPKFYAALDRWKKLKAWQRPKAAGLDALNEALDELEKAKDMYNMAKDRSMLKGMATVLGWFNNDPKLSLLVTETDIVIAAWYNRVAREVSLGQIEMLTKLTEDDLKAIKKVSDLMKRHVEELNSYKRQRDQLSNCG